MMEFEKQSEIMDMKEEMMNDAIDDAMGDEDDEEERWGTETSNFIIIITYQRNERKSQYKSNISTFCYVSSGSWTRYIFNREAAL